MSELDLSQFEKKVILRNITEADIDQILDMQKVLPGDGAVEEKPFEKSYRHIPRRSILCGS